MGIGDLCRCTLQWYAPGEPDKVQGRDRVGIVEGSYGYRARGVSIRGKFILSRNLEFKTRAGRHVAKRFSDPRLAYPEVKIQVWDLMRVVDIIAPFAPRWVSIRGKFVYRAAGLNGHRRPVPSAPQQRL